MTNNNKLIVYVAEVETSEQSGMGRVAVNWQRAFEARNWEFVQITPSSTEKLWHKSLFPAAAYQKYLKLRKKAAVFLVHEPASGAFVKHGIPVAVFSHGLERRGWQLELSRRQVSLRSRIAYPIWRLLGCDIGIKNANLLFLSNTEDKNFVEEHYQVNPAKIYVFRNGVYTTSLNETVFPDKPAVLFLGSWIERKGIEILIKAAALLYEEGITLNWLIAANSSSAEPILNAWSASLRNFVEVIGPRKTQAEEDALYAASNIFVLPSYYEGQPLALLQAMAAGRLCITTNCCGQKDIIKHEYNGLLHEPGDAFTLAGLLKQSINNEALRLTLGKNARLTVAERSWETVCLDVVDRVEYLLNDTLPLSRWQ